MKKLCVIGFPSKLGGADTELDHQIDCWLAMGIEVHLIHTGGFDRRGLLMKKDVEKRGCIVHRPRQWSAAEGMHVISYCNGGFLTHLEEIKKYARCATFVGCMTWPFEKEKRAHQAGLIDLELFQTKHQMEMISPHLEKISPGFNWSYTVPYWNSKQFPFIDPATRTDDEFRFGRISRADPAKFTNCQMGIYNEIKAPVPKSGLVLGYSDRIRRKTGAPPSFVKVVQCGVVSQQEFYKFASCVIQACDTHENLPRVGFEAMSSGSVLVVDDRGGWRELVDHEKTGFLCNSKEEFIEYSNILAQNTQLRCEMANAAKIKLDGIYGLEQSKQSWREIFDKMEKIEQR